MSATETFRRLSGHQRIAGRIVKSSGDAVIDVTDPATEQRLGQIADAGPSEIDEAVEIANTAQSGWRRALRRGRIDIRAIYMDLPDRSYYYWRGINPAAMIALAAGCITYVVLLNPLTYDSTALYPYLTASLPAAAAAALIYFLGSLLVIRAGRGGYPAT
jgi:hypothetical protein